MDRVLLPRHAAGGKNGIEGEVARLELTVRHRESAVRKHASQRRASLVAVEVAHEACRWKFRSCRKPNRAGGRGSTPRDAGVLER